MSIFISSDTHGTLDVDKVCNFFRGKASLTKADYLIICGDVGVCGFHPTVEKETIAALRALPVTVLFCDGNHENFASLNSYQPEEWHGGLVHRIYNDIIHLMRGQVYEIENQRFFVFGGAYSTDRAFRIEGRDWFEEEIPTQEEIETAWANLEAVDYTVDYVITHTAPYEVIAAMYGDIYDEEEPFNKELQRMADTMQFEQWFFGHFHRDECVEEFTCVYDEIIELP